MNFQMFKLDLDKAGEPENKLPTSIGSWNQLEYVIYHNFFKHCSESYNQFNKTWNKNVIYNGQKILFFF